MMPAGATMGQQQSTKLRVTHVEVRRVQNGYVVMAMDYAANYYEAGRKPTVASFVATDEEGVKTIIGNILLSAELDWLPSVDLPMVEMQRIVAAREEGLMKRAAEEAAESMTASHYPPAAFTIRDR